MPLAFYLSWNRNKSLYHDLFQLLRDTLGSDDFDAGRVRPLLDAILQLHSGKFVWDAVYNAVTKSTPSPRPPLSINTGTFANSTEYRKYSDNVLKVELGDMYVDIPGFFDAFFGDVPGLRPSAQAVFDKCKAGDSPLFQVESGWQGWPGGAKEKDVLSWFVPLIDQLLDLTEEHQPESRVRRRRPLAQPHRPLKGSAANRKLDFGFVDELNGNFRWSHFLEMKESLQAARHDLKE